MVWCKAGKRSSQTVPRATTAGECSMPENDLCVHTCMNIILRHFIAVGTMVLNE